MQTSANGAGRASPTGAPRPGGAVAAGPSPRHVGTHLVGLPRLVGHDGRPGGAASSVPDERDRPRVLSVPHRRAYVRGVVDLDDVVVLGAPSRGPRSLGLDPGWVTEHRHSFDVMHVHGGLAHADPWALRELVGVLRGHGKRLVVTVHDLRHPRLLDNSALDDALDVVVPAADAVLTLTHAAAVRVARRWGRGAGVVPHPCVVPPDAMARLRAPWVRRAGRVGIHLADVAPNSDVGPVLVALERLVASDPGVTLDVRIHDGAWDQRHRLRERLRRLARRDDVEVYVHDRLTDEALNGWLGSLQVAVLPHRFGTHTTWIERCKDLATAIVTADIDSYVEQGATTTFPADGERLAAEPVLAAVRRALDVTPEFPRPAQRQVQRADVRRTHTRLYRRLAGLPAPGPVELVVLDDPSGDEVPTDAATAHDLVAAGQDTCTASPSRATSTGTDG